MRQLITEDLEEPKEDGLYLIYSNDDRYVENLHRSEDGWHGSDITWIDSDGNWLRWEEIALLYCMPSHYYIESLSDHDKRIRSEAWGEGKEAESEYWKYLSEAWCDTEVMDELEEPTNPYRMEKS